MSVEDVESSFFTDKVDENIFYANNDFDMKLIPENSDYSDANFNNKELNKYKKWTSKYKSNVHGEFKIFAHKQITFTNVNFSRANLNN
jgi:hypothetical protein